MCVYDPNTLFAEFTSAIDFINESVKHSSDGIIEAFSPITVRRPELKIAIHGFYTSVTWLYVVYFEAGQTTINFLAERAVSFNLDAKGLLKKHRSLIHAFRTYLQHNFDFLNREDIIKRKLCFDWIQDQFDVQSSGYFAEPWPETEQQWINLLLALLLEAKQFINTLKHTLGMILADESREDVMKVWISRVKRKHLPYEWDQIASEVASEMGFRELDILVFRKRYIEKWNQGLKILKEDYDFSYEARRLVEQTLLNEEILLLPITGSDIINELCVPPGRKVKELLTQAKNIFLKTGCGKGKLLSELKKYLVDISMQQ